MSVRKAQAPRPRPAATRHATAGSRTHAMVTAPWAGFAFRFTSFSVNAVASASATNSMPAPVAAAGAGTKSSVARRTRARLVSSVRATSSFPILPTANRAAAYHKLLEYSVIRIWKTNDGVAQQNSPKMRLKRLALLALVASTRLRCGSAFVSPQQYQRRVLLIPSRHFTARQRPFPRALS